MIEFDVNGEPVAAPETDETLVEVLRDRLGLCGTKLVCGGGVCGACTVHLDGVPVLACLTPTTAAEGRSVTTIEGVGAPLHPIQRAFAAFDALQCGYCTPGFVMAAIGFYDDWRARHGTKRPPRDEIAAALAGNLCRCGAHEAILAAVAAACADDPAIDEPPVRVDALDKVTGRAVFTTDVRLDGMLEGVVVRSPVAHAHLHGLDLDPARALGAVAVDLRRDDPTLRYVGDPIAAVAAPTRREAEDAAAAIGVHLEARPAALVPGADPPVFPDRRSRKRAANASEGPLRPARWRGNVRGPVATSFPPFVARTRIRRTDPARLHGGTFVTASQTHTPLEPHATVARWEGNRLTVWTSTQAVDAVRTELARHLNLDPSQVRVVAEHVGGGFGSKLSMDDTVLAAVELARIARLPVRVVMDRQEELTVGGHRPAVHLDVALAVDDGHLDAITLDAASETGAAINSPVGAIPFFMYGRAPRSMHDWDLLSHHPPGKPFRGPGGPPSLWAVEQVVDDVALSLGVDPIELRRRWDGNPKRRALYDEARALDLWRERPREPGSGRFRRGVGVAAGNWAYFVDPDARIGLEVREGVLRATSSVQEIGTGTRTVIARALAGEFHGAPIEVVIGDSELPYGPMSAGSRTATSVGPAAVAAAEHLRALAAERLAVDLGGPVVAEVDGIRHAGELLPWPDVLPRLEGLSTQATRPGDAGGFLSPFTMLHTRLGRGSSGAVHVVEVEVDTLLGRIRVVRCWAGISAGRMWSPITARSQVEGAVIQGIGYALYEERVLDPASGRTLTANLEDYRIPGIADVPEIEVSFNEEGWEHVPGGGVGIGEVATLPVAAAIGNAVRAATGWRPRRLPIRPEHVVEGVGR